MFHRLCRCLLTAIGAQLAVSCTYTDFDRIPRTDYIQHYEECNNPHIPFVSYWSAMSDSDWDRMVERKSEQKIYMPPVSLHWFADMPQSAAEQRQIEELRSYFDRSIRKLIHELDVKDASFRMVDAPGPGVYVMDYAILCAKPARVLKNAAMAVPGYVVKYSGPVVSTVFGDKEDTGYIAMGARFFDDKGTLLAEMADFEYGVESVTGHILIDTKNFRPYAYQHQTIDHWVKEFRDIYTTVHATAIKRPSIYFNPF